jgi:1-acyl-sn-glycerol-3-phosphate acyltransferase
MFPEGTRSPDGRLRSFKTGAFELAKDTGNPILPIVVTGTSDALPKRGFVLRGRHPIHIKVLDGIPYETFADESIENLTDRVHTLIAAEIERASPSPAV